MGDDKNRLFWAKLISKRLFFNISTPKKGPSPFYEVIKAFNKVFSD